MKKVSEDKNVKRLFKILEDVSKDSGIEIKEEVKTGPGLREQIELSNIIQYKAITNKAMLEYLKTNIYNNSPTVTLPSTTTTTPLTIKPASFNPYTINWLSDKL